MRNTRRLEEPERADLDDHRQRLEHEQPADDGQQQDVLVISARAASAVPMASDPVSPMKIRAGCGVPPQEPGARPEHRRRDDREVERVGDVVDRPGGGSPRTR